MPRELELGNSENWESIWSNTITAQQGTFPNSHLPIPNQEVPILLNRHVLACAVSSATAKPTWNFAGFLGQKLFSGLIVGGSPDTFAVNKYKLWLDRITLLTFDKLTPTYSVVFEIPKWFDQVTINLWQYIGADRDSTDDLIEITRFELFEVALDVKEIKQDLENSGTI